MKFATGMIVVCGLAAAANAGITATWESIDTVNTAAVTSVYSSLAGNPGYSAFANAAGPAGFDDYSSTEGAAFNLAQFKFVGGVGAINDQMKFEFFDAAGTLVNNFTVALPQAGFFIWTITLGAQPDGSDSTFSVANAGFVQGTAVVGTGRWGFTTLGPSIGTNNIAVGTGSTLAPQRYNAFELVKVPTPGSLALLGLGGLMAGRRRR